MRDFHRQVRVVYRACRRIYGTEKTQDECLRVFKVVFPELNRIRQSDKEMESISMAARNALYGIIRSWNASGHLKEVIERAESYLEIPMECDKGELIKFLEDITPVAMRIRKLTPTETGRLMGMNDDEIQKMYDAGLSNSAMYKLHGNSIVVDVMTEMFDKLFINTDEDREAGSQLTLF